MSSTQQQQVRPSSPKARAQKWLLDNQMQNAMYISAAIAFALLFIQYLVMHFELSPTYLGYGTILSRLWSVINLVFLFFFYTRINIVLPGAAILSAVPFGFYLFYAVAEQMFHDDSVQARIDNTKNSTLTNVIMIVALLVAYLLSKIGLPKAFSAATKEDVAAAELAAESNLMA